MNRYEIRKKYPYLINLTPRQVEDLEIFFDDLKKIWQLENESQVEALKKEVEEWKVMVETASKEKHGASGLCCGLRENLLKENKQLQSRIAELEAGSKFDKPQMIAFAMACSLLSLQEGKNIEEVINHCFDKNYPTPPLTPKP